MCGMMVVFLAVVAAGIAAERRPPAAGVGEGGGAVVMFDVKQLQEVRRVGMPSHVAAVKWQPKINQIFVGIGEREGERREGSKRGKEVFRRYCMANSIGPMGNSIGPTNDEHVPPCVSCMLFVMFCLSLHPGCSTNAVHPLHACVFVILCVFAGDKRGGSAHVLYDTTYSRRGALLAVTRAPRVVNPFDIGLSVVIKNPHALPMYREDAGRKRGREKARNVRGTEAEEGG